MTHYAFKSSTQWHSARAPICKSLILQHLSQLGKTGTATATMNSRRFNIGTQRDIDRMTSQNTYRLSKAVWTLTCIVSMGVTAYTPSTAQAQDALEQNREVSYVVFHESVGFGRPTIKPDWLDGSIMVRFRRIPANWSAALTPQISTLRKKRFFKAIDPVSENGALVGIRLHLGIGVVSVHSHPTTWQSPAYSVG